MGNSAAFIYLGSPATVAASMIEGCIADPRPYVQAAIEAGLLDADGRPVGCAAPSEGGAR